MSSQSTVIMAALLVAGLLIVIGILLIADLRDYLDKSKGKKS